MDKHSEQRFTLDEAKRELAKRECYTHGHSWEVLGSLGDGPHRITCDSCGWSGSVTMGARP